MRQAYTPFDPLRTTSEGLQTTIEVFCGELKKQPVAMHDPTHYTSAFTLKHSLYSVDKVYRNVSLSVELKQWRCLTVNDFGMDCVKLSRFLTPPRPTYTFKGSPDRAKMKGRGNRRQWEVWKGSECWVKGVAHQPRAGIKMKRKGRVCVRERNRGLSTPLKGSCASKCVCVYMCIVQTFVKVYVYSLKF